MIVAKVQKHSKQNKVVPSKPSADTETTTSGIRVPTNDINVCAYHLYQNRGGKHGYDIQDWLKAERQITQR
jgi:hypothetical protein